MLVLLPENIVEQLEGVTESRSLSGVAVAAAGSGIPPMGAALLGTPDKQMGAVGAVSPVTSMSSAVALTAGAASSGTTTQMVVDEFGVVDAVIAGTDAGASFLGPSDEQMVGVGAVRSVLSRLVETSVVAEAGGAEPPNRWS